MKRGGRLMHDLLSLKKIVIAALLLLSATFATAQPETDDQPDDVINVYPGQDVEPEYFDSIYQLPEEVRPRKINDTLLQEMLADEDYWYANVAPERKKIQPKKETTSPGFFEQEWVKSLVWLLMIGIFVAIIAWFLASSNIRLFTRKKLIPAEDSDIITEEDLFSIDYNKAIAAAEQEENYRLATRLWFLFTLRNLTEKELIRYKHEKTNSDYLDQLFGTPWYKPFFALTRNFEYTWYGKFDLKSETYELVQKDFSSFNQQLQS